MWLCVCVCRERGEWGVNEERPCAKIRRLGKERKMGREGENEKREDAWREASRGSRKREGAAVLLHHSV